MFPYARSSVSGVEEIWDFLAGSVWNKIVRSPIPNSPVKFSCGHRHATKTGAEACSFDPLKLRIESDEPEEEEPGPATKIAALTEGAVLAIVTGEPVAGRER